MGALLGYDEALKEMIEAASPLGKEIVALGRAGRRRLAEPVQARSDTPAYDLSAMDGYAVPDLKAGDWRVTGSTRAGDCVSVPLGFGECRYVTTGSKTPVNCLAVLPVEIVSRQGDTITLTGNVPEKPHVRRGGDDFIQGDLVLSAGIVVDPRVMMALAACDLGEIKVWRRPRLSVIVTGNELTEPGSASDQSDCIPDSVSEALLLFARQWGAKPTFSVRVADDERALATVAHESLAVNDVVVVVGGASAGDRDFTKQAFRKAGVDIAWQGVAMKPGKPAWFGKAGQKNVVGLPGNPTAALTVSRLFLAPLLSILGGGVEAEAFRWTSRALSDTFAHDSQRIAFLTATFDGDLVSIDRDQRSSGQIRLASSNGLVRIEPGRQLLEKGQKVPFLAW